MIVKGQARGRAAQLAAHLLSAEQNESIRLYECRGTLAKDVSGALFELEARGLAGRSKRPLYHASISPEATRPLDERQIAKAVDILEQKLGLHGQPRVVVVHCKKNREHVHVVWSRMDIETGKAVGYSWNYRLHEAAAREMEVAFGHRPLPSSGDRRSKRRRPANRSIEGYEHRQAERSGIRPSAVTSDVTALWRGSRNGADFKRKLEEAGYILARGDRRVFVIIDQSGNVHSLARRIEGANTAALRARMRDVGLDSLSSVSAVRRRQQSKTVVGDRRRKFALAARETTRVGYIAPVRRTMAEIGLNLASVAQPCDHKGEVPAFRPGHGRSPATIFYRSARAALFADFASRIAAARRYLSDDQLVAAIAALEAERNAALDRLKESQPWRKARDRKTRSGSRARLRFRALKLRPRRKPS
ncbi:hypothetical protein BSN85_16310 [Bradyrhizobium brasilense]|uniref:relaxase/mobilization nuclease domain-containing protein n=1 Tax=Bradyrhizobium brasilense TaxID=1419277 RepID=UPI000977835B|nr:relaxase/mobilization nuclease domain-containing protein [Bradyrhizobium brasilense]OMI09491.1 hypothetical protein BSN85_16310 [Bradyrhizobium brasilense]